MLLGRSSELRRLLEAVDAARPVAIIGPPGIGKTKLVEALAGQRPVALGQCLDSFSHRPYQPILHALGRPPSPQHARALAREVAAGLAGRLLVVEDAHWADGPTLEVLAELMGDRSVVVTARSGLGATAVQGLVLAGSGEVVELGPLSVDVIDEVLRRVAPSLVAGERSRVASRCGGNPLVATVLARRLDRIGSQLIDDLPISDAVAALAAVVADLDPGPRRTLALMGRSDVPLANDLADDVELLAASGLVNCAGGRPVPSGHLLSELAWSALNRDEQQEVRSRLLESGGLRPAERAELLWHSGEAAEAYDVAVGAAAGPLSRAEQAQVLRVAALAANELTLTAISPPAVGGDLEDLLISAAGALNDSAAFAPAAEVLSLPVPVDGAPSPERAAEMLRAASAGGDRTYRDCVVRSLGPWMDRLGAESPRVLALWRMLAHPTEGRASVAELAEQGFLSAANSLDRSHAAFLLAVAAYRDDAEDAVRLLEVARSEAQHGGPTSDLEASRNLVLMQLGIGRHEEARALAQSCAERAHAEGLTSWALEFRTHELISRFHDHVDHDEAVGWLSWVRTEPVRLETRALATSALATLLADRGAVVRSGEVLAPWMQPEELEGFEPMVQAVLVWAAVQRAWIIGSLDEAVRLARWVTDVVPRGFPALAGTQVVWRWAELESGHELTAPDPVGGLMPCAALEAEGVTLLATGDHLAAARQFGDAGDAWSALLWRCALRCRWAQGLALVRAGHGEGVGLLVELDTELDEAGFPALRPRVHAALREAGAPVASVTGGSSGDLSPRQGQVLNLVAEGLTSSQIARRLGVSVDTVNSHVRLAMSKLGASTRIEAAAAVAMTAV